jgi:hypothetical protein
MTRIACAAALLLATTGMGPGAERPAAPTPSATGAALALGTRTMDARDLSPRERDRARALGFDSGRSGMLVRFAAETTPYRVAAHFVMPGERIDVAAVDAPRDLVADVGARGTLPTADGATWTWSAPYEPGLYPLTLSDGSGSERFRLNVFVLVPASEARGELLKGYRLGAYPATPLRGLDAYRAPEGLVEVTEENLDAEISPHFRLGQFLCKQDGGWPKYVVLRPRLPLMLERVLEAVNAAGHRADSLHVMSGYRTPFYNQAIGNVPHSRHVFGGAADVFVDAHPEDGRMDDLNGDGVSDLGDARYLYEMIDRMFDGADADPMLGGLGLYDSTPAHGPFVHVDVRGVRARWGQ